MPLMEAELDMCGSFHLKLNPSPIGLMTFALPRTFFFFFHSEKLLFAVVSMKNVFFFFKGKTVYGAQIARV